MRTKEFTVMRYVAVLASVLAVLTLFSAIPVAVCDSSEATPFVPSDYVGTEDVTLYGMVGGYNPDDTSFPQVYVFVVYTDLTDPENPKYLYLNVNKNQMLTANVVPQYNETTKETEYVFSIDVPQIISNEVEYYIYVFNNYKIDSVPPTIKPQGVTITPEEGWTDPTSVGDYKAYMIKHDDPWADWDTETQFDLSKYGTETGYKIALTKIGAEGTVRGHVSGLIGSNSSDLNDVLVRFYKNNEFVRDTTTDRNGNYSVTLPTGDYTVTFSRGNYSCEPIDVKVIEGSTTAKEVTMTLKVENDFFGQDLSHFLTIVGGVVCGLIILISIAYQWRRIKQKKSGKDWILDDMEEMDEE